ncbi:MAG: sugar phosphate isomerase/epimerase [Prolixibacteraceae bacterium]|nr:sugar phosphate isomerase/epimerase [Prolixibacteraceae bacterium]
MSNIKFSRRKMLGNSCLVLIGAMGSYAFNSSDVSVLTLGKSNDKKKLPFRISLNTSTISAYKLSVEKQIDLVADAGFDGIELWVRDVTAYLNEGGTCESLQKRLMSRNLVLENMIGFAPWFSEDTDARAKGIEQLHQEMIMTAKLGGEYIAAPIQGLKTLDKLKFDDYTQRYRNILQQADQTGVTPIIELWGAGALNQLADCAQIVISTGHPKASMLLDFYHLYRGNNSWNTLDCINAHRLPVFHINDYPASPAREQLKDSDRVFPGDGICPFNELIPKLYNAGFRGAFSVELFNKNYWATMDAPTILKTSYEKTCRVINDAMSNKS